MKTVKKFRVLKDKDGNKIGGRIWRAERLVDVGGLLDVTTHKIRKADWHITGDSGVDNDPIDDYITDEFLDNLIDAGLLAEIKEDIDEKHYMSNYYKRFWFYELQGKRLN